MKIICKFFIMITILSSCSYVGPHLPTYNKTYIGDCVLHDLVDSRGKLYKVAGLSKGKDHPVLFVDKKANFINGNNYDFYIGHKVVVIGDVPYSDGNMIKFNDDYIGFHDWQRRLNSLNDNMFNVITVCKIRVLDSTD